MKSASPIKFHQTTTVIGMSGKEGRMITDQVIDFLTLRGDKVFTVNFDIEVMPVFRAMFGGGEGRVYGFDHEEKLRDFYHMQDRSDFKKCREEPPLVAFHDKTGGIIYRTDPPRITGGVDIDYGLYYQVIREMALSKVEDSSLVIQVKLGKNTNPEAEKLVEEIKQKLIPIQAWQFRFMLDSRGNRCCTFKEATWIDTLLHDDKNDQMLPLEGTGGYNAFLY